MTTLYYQPPSHLRVTLINPLLRFLVMRFGLGSSGEQDMMRILRVRGRKSGREYDVPRLAGAEIHYKIAIESRGPLPG